MRSKRKKLNANLFLPEINKQKRLYLKNIKTIKEIKNNKFIVKKGRKGLFLQLLPNDDDNN